MTEPHPELGSSAAGFDGASVALEIDQVHTYRGDNYVLQGVSVQVHRGACTTILGRNGMGKTTLVRSVMALNPPLSGRIEFEGTELTGMSPHRVARQGLAYVPQGRRIFQSLSVEENLTFVTGKRVDDEQWTLARVYDLFPNLKHRRRNKGCDLSGGEQQMLAIGRALMSGPRLIVMDEPSEGLAPVIVQRVGEVIAALREQRLSILLVEQNYKLGISSADHAYVLANGSVVWSGRPKALDAAEDVKLQHLGV